MMRFADVIGHKNIIANLQSAIESERVNSGYIFCGPSGVGKNMTLRAFAATLLCEKSGIDSCGECHSCKMIEAGTHPDFTELVLEKAEIPVSQMREFCREAGIKPVHSKRRVCIIPEADKMNDASANCFLKTLEEPPGATVILLRGESTDRMLKTIVSRCQAIRLGPLKNEEVASFLLRENKTQSEEQAKELSIISEGSIGKAVSLSEGEAAEDWRWLKEILGNFTPAKSLVLADGLVERLSSKGNDSSSKRIRALELLDAMALLFRLRIKQNRSVRKSLAAIDLLWQASERIDRNVSPDLVLQSLSLNLVYR
jgi:DNA polymerase-3 subunit delta'